MTITTNLLPLAVGEAQAIEVLIDGRVIGKVLRYARDRWPTVKWHWEAANGGRGEVRTKREAMDAVVELWTRR